MNEAADIGPKRLTTHKHKCAFCGWVWEHPDSCDIKHGDEGFHECARCKRCNWSLGIYTGDEPPSMPDKESQK